MTGVAPISLYMLVPALPVLATAFGRDISIAQMTVSLYMVGIACSQIIMGPLSDRFGRRPVLLAGIGDLAGAGTSPELTGILPLLNAAPLLDAVGGAPRLAVSPAHLPEPYQPDHLHR